MNYGRNSKTTQKAHSALLCGSGWYERQHMPCKLLQVLQKVLSTSACMQAWCDKKGLDAAIHPIPKCVIFLEDLLQEMVVNKSNVACSRTPQWRYRDRYHCEVCSSIERLRSLMYNIRECEDIVHDICLPHNMRVSHQYTPEASTEYSTVTCSAS